MDILGHSECASKADVWWDYEVQSPPKGVGGYDFPSASLGQTF